MLTPEQVEASFIDKKSKERRGHSGDDVDKTVEDVGFARRDLVLVHQKYTVSGVGSDGVCVNGE
jgi:hypothetical protein